MSNIATTPIKDNNKIIAYVVPAEEYETLKAIEMDDDQQLSSMADEARKEGLVTPERAEEINHKAEILWNLRTQS